MRKSLFAKIHYAVVRDDSYFEEKVNGLGRPCLSLIQKITTALHIFSGSIASNNVVEYVRIAEFITIECFKRFATAVVEIFGDEFLRHPTEEDILHHLQLNELCGFSRNV